MALNCSNAGMKGRSIKRHNDVVAMFAKTLKRGKKRRLRITYDAGKTAREAQNRTTGSYTLDAELLALDGRFVEGRHGLWEFVSSHVPEAVDAERYEVGKMNPDIVMVENAVTKDSRGTIHIIEVGGYCWDPNWVGKQEAKEQAYAEVVAALLDSGYGRGISRCSRLVPSPG